MVLGTLNEEVGIYPTRMHFRFTNMNVGSMKDTSQSGYFDPLRSEIWTTLM